MDELKEWGRRYISGRVVQPHDAVMFDIDDTLIYTNEKLNTPIIELLHDAKKQGYQIIIIISRTII
jgi:hydroxymethylpyrimidine pyrophosphatase-like HAD family hydrolase